VDVDPSTSVGLSHTDGIARRTIACFERYEDAQALVDRLADSGFPVERLRIVGRDLRLVERVTGRLNAARAALGGAGSGAAFAGLFGLLFGLWFSPDGVSLLATVLYWLVAGALFGALFGLIGYSATGGQRDFTSVSGMQAGHFEVVAEEAVAEEAQRLAEATPPGAASSGAQDRPTAAPQ
jgi:hypothetical protein